MNMSKETRGYVKRHQQICQKKPTNISKEISRYVKRKQQTCQKRPHKDMPPKARQRRCSRKLHFQIRPVNKSKETYASVERDQNKRQNNSVYMRKEKYSCCKRDS